MDGKKLICTESGNIYYATIRENGLLSSKDRVDLTEDAVSAVVDHLTTMDDFASEGLSGYSMHNKNGMEARLVLFDTSKFEIKPIDKVILFKRLNKIELFKIIEDWKAISDTGNTEFAKGLSFAYRRVLGLLKDNK